MASTGELIVCEEPKAQHGVGGPAPAGDSTRAVQKAVLRRQLDFVGPYIRLAQARLSAPDLGPAQLHQPTFASSLSLLPPSGYISIPATSLDAQYVHTIHARSRSPIVCLVWTPDGRRLFSAANNGMVTYWNSSTYTSENQLQLGNGHAVRCITFSHSGLHLLAADDTGRVQLLAANMDLMNAYGAHKEACRAVCWSPTDLKFASCSDDSTVKVFDIIKGQERSMTGHGGDVRWVDWHPRAGLVASGSKDACVKLWDPRTPTGCMATLHGHKNAVFQVRWNDNGNWLLTCSRDQLLKVYDVRTQRELNTYRGHNKDVTTCAWHPVHESVFASGSIDGGLIMWLVGQAEPQAEVPAAHEGTLWSLAWHHLGHVMATGGQDARTQLWCRKRPGELLTDKYDSTHYGLDDTTVSFGLMGGTAGTGAAAIPGVGAGAAGAKASFIPGIGEVKDLLEQLQQGGVVGMVAASAASVGLEGKSSTLRGTGGRGQQGTIAGVKRGRADRMDRHESDMHRPDFGDRPDGLSGQWDDSGPGRLRRGFPGFGPPRPFMQGPFGGGDGGGPPSPHAGGPHVRPGGPALGPQPRSQGGGPPHQAGGPWAGSARGGPTQGGGLLPRSLPHPHEQLGPGGAGGTGSGAGPAGYQGLGHGPVPGRGEVYDRGPSGPGGLGGPPGGAPGPGLFFGQPPPPHHRPSGPQGPWPSSSHGKGCYEPDYGPGPGHSPGRGYHDDPPYHRPAPSQGAPPPRQTGRSGRGPHAGVGPPGVGPGRGRGALLTATTGSGLRPPPRPDRDRDRDRDHGGIGR